MKLIALSALVGSALGAGWTYSDQVAGWNAVAGGYCDGKRQSPINIVDKNSGNGIVDPLDAANFVAATFSGTKRAALNDPTSDSTHALKYTFQSCSTNLAGVETCVDSPLAGWGLLCPQFHYHFDSEHEVEGNLYFGEYHVVCHQDQFADLGAALGTGRGDALRVFGFMVEEDSTATDNAQMAEFINHKVAGAMTGGSVNIPLPNNIAQSRYWRYDGSLTTPTCNEAVTWTVFADSVRISTAQADTIRTWREGYLIGNNRVTLNINGRDTTSFENSCMGTDRTVCATAQALYNSQCVSKLTCTAAQTVFAASADALKAAGCNCNGAAGLVSSIVLVIATFFFAL